MVAPHVRVIQPTDDRLVDLVRWIVPDAETAGLVLNSSCPCAERRVPDSVMVVEAYEPGRSLAGVVALQYPDSTAHCLPPRLQAGVGRETAVALLERLVAELAHRRIKWLTAHISPQDLQGPACFAQAGFRRTHDMLVLCAETSRANGTVPLDDWLLHPVEPSSHGELRTVYPRTLIMTRDFPDIRLDVPIEGVLSRFAQSGTTGRRLWYLVQRGGQTAGCLLLADHEDLDRCELIYMGLVPEFRGQGGGRVLVYRALEMTRQLGRSNLVAVVDAENDPALAAYAVNGFEPLVRRCLFVRWLGSPGELSGV